MVRSMLRLRIGGRGRGAQLLP